MLKYVNHHMQWLSETRWTNELAEIQWKSKIKMFASCQLRWKAQLRTTWDWWVDVIDGLDKICLPFWKDIIVSLSSSIIWTRRPLIPITLFEKQENYKSQSKTKEGIVWGKKKYKEK